MFISITMHHLRAIKTWADAHKGTANLDLSSFELEVKARNRYYRLYPQFLSDSNGRLSHVTALTPQSTSFIGWRPYKPLSCPLAVDKLLFKSTAAQCGLRTPAHWMQIEQAQADFILKRSSGSFGYQLAGPFRQGHTPDVPPAMTAASARGQLFAEAFIPGQNIKAWFWGDAPVHVQCQPYARVRGDGQRPVKALVNQLMQEVRINPATYRDFNTVLSCLAYQGTTPDATLPQGEEVWLDYRYGRTFSRPATTEAEDNAWSRLPEAQRLQISEAGSSMARALKNEVKPPMLFTLDGVLDESGNIWWLELNSNPICPPTAYFTMLGSLFGTSTQAPAHTYSLPAQAQTPPALREKEVQNAA